MEDVELTKRQHLHPNATASTHTTTATIISTAAATTGTATKAKCIKVENSGNIEIVFNPLVSLTMEPFEGE